MLNQSLENTLNTLDTSKNIWRWIASKLAILVLMKNVGPKAPLSHSPKGQISKIEKSKTLIPTVYLIFHVSFKLYVGSQ